MGNGGGFKMSRGLINLLGISGALVVLGQVPDAQAKTRQVNCSSSQATQAAKYLFERVRQQYYQAQKGVRTAFDSWIPALKDVATKGSIPCLCLHGIKSKIRLWARLVTATRRAPACVRVACGRYRYQKNDQDCAEASCLGAVGSCGVACHGSEAFGTMHMGSTKEIGRPISETITENRKIIERNVGKQPAKNSSLGTPGGFYDENANSPAIDNSFRRISHDSSFTIPSRAWQGSKVLLLPFDHVNAPQRLSAQPELLNSLGARVDGPMSRERVPVRHQDHPVSWRMGSIWAKSQILKPVKIQWLQVHGLFKLEWQEWTANHFRRVRPGRPRVSFQQYLLRRGTHHLFGVVSLQSYSICL